MFVDNEQECYRSDWFNFQTAIKFGPNEKLKYLFRRQPVSTLFRGCWKSDNQRLQLSSKSPKTTIKRQTTKQHYNWRCSNNIRKTTTPRSVNLGWVHFLATSRSRKGQFFFFLLFVPDCKNENELFPKSSQKKFTRVPNSFVKIRFRNLVSEDCGKLA